MEQHVYPGVAPMTGEHMRDVALDFDFVLSFLPDGWEEKAKELGRCAAV
jgi:hypothetical protein